MWFYAVIKERLVKVAQLYSPMIADCIAEMLVYSVDERTPVQDLALVVFMNSGAEKVEKTGKDQMIQPNARAGNRLPPLPKPNPPALQQQQQQLQQQQQQQQQLQQQQKLQQQQQLQQKGNQQNSSPVQPQYVMVQGQPMQIGPNNIAMPVPNYAYSHIGPNNQSLLSSSSLQSKLRVI